MALARIAKLPSHRKLERDLEHVTQEMYRRNKELADTNRTLSLLRTIDSLALEARDSIKVLAGQITDSIASSIDDTLVAIYSVSSLKTDRLELLGLSTRGGFTLEKGILDDIMPSIKHHWYSNPEKNHLVSLSRTSAHNLTLYLGCSSDTADKLKATKLRTAFVAKLQVRQRLVGVIIVASERPATEFEKSDIELLERLAETVGLALDNKLLFEENTQVLSQLRNANSRLKELDQTKDEFISMASHQLRTPLTTIKGYLSMVLEGDVGPVTKNEKQMIQQAFDSAERMVFLIGDLLNVSRLQSGKFVIDNKPTDLIKMVKTEVEQLKETAEHHGLKLICNTPDKLPLFNLDDTKIRQVVMNFMDNAIYYTPSGGSITVNLETTADTISYTVVDTGLGVPKAEQHHLFTKFYRAGNARKMRPDGTGLGLFMAKKVIVAQGGAIIFKSEEGKGSTFGFSFPRRKIEIKGSVTEKPAAAAV